MRIVSWSVLLVLFGMVCISCAVGTPKSINTHTQRYELRGLASHMAMVDGREQEKDTGESYGERENRFYKRLAAGVKTAVGEKGKIESFPYCVYVTGKKDAQTAARAFLDKTAKPYNYVVLLQPRLLRIPTNQVAAFAQACKTDKSIHGAIDAKTPAKVLTAAQLKTFESLAKTAAPKGQWNDLFSNKNKTYPLDGQPLVSRYWPDAPIPLVFKKPLSSREKFAAANTENILPNSPPPFSKPQGKFHVSVDRRADGKLAVILRPSYMPRNGSSGGPRGSRIVLAGPSSDVLTLPLAAGQSIVASIASDPIADDGPTYLPKDHAYYLVLTPKLVPYPNTKWDVLPVPELTAAQEAAFATAKQSPSVGQWSQPVNGLQARIRLLPGQFSRKNSPSSKASFEFKNTTHHALTIRWVRDYTWTAVQVHAVDNKHMPSGNPIHSAGGPSPGSNANLTILPGRTVRIGVGWSKMGMGLSQEGPLHFVETAGFGRDRTAGYGFQSLDTDFFLTGTLTEQRRITPSNVPMAPIPNLWRGTIALAPVLIPPKGTPETKQYGALTELLIAKSRLVWLGLTLDDVISRLPNKSVLTQKERLELPNIAIAKRYGQPVLLRDVVGFKTDCKPLEIDPSDPAVPLSTLDEPHVRLYYYTRTKTQLQEIPLPDKMVTQTYDFIPFLNRVDGKAFREFSQVWLPTGQTADVLVSLSAPKNLAGKSLPVKFSSVQSVLCTYVAPATWRWWPHPPSTPGKIEYKGNMAVITQSERVHKQIAAFLQTWESQPTPQGHMEMRVYRFNEHTSGMSPAAGQTIYTLSNAEVKKQFAGKTATISKAVPITPGAWQVTDTVKPTPAEGKFSLQTGMQILTKSHTLPDSSAAVRLVYRVIDGQGKPYGKRDFDLAMGWNEYFNVSSEKWTIIRVVSEPNVVTRIKHIGRVGKGRYEISVKHDPGRKVSNRGRTLTTYMLFRTVGPGKPD
jgi:hypothetical protein